MLQCTSLQKFPTKISYKFTSYSIQNYSLQYTSTHTYNEWMYIQIKEYKNAKNTKNDEAERWNN